MTLEKKFEPTLSKLQSYSVSVLNKKISKANFVKVVTLVRIWGSAVVVSFLAIMVIYTLFFGRNKITLNETIYEGYRFVGQPGAVQLATDEGYGLTSFGQDGLIVNKTLDPTVFRVLFIGDSFVKAKQVSDHEKFTELIEGIWNRTHPDRPIQTLNLGLGGQGMPTYLSFGDNMDKRFHPDLVFIQLGENDFVTLGRDSQSLEKVAQEWAEPLVKPERASTLHNVINWLGFRSFFGQLQAQTYGFLSRTDEANKVRAAEEKSLLNDEAIAIQLKALQKIWGDRLVIIYRVKLSNLGQDIPGKYKNEILREIDRQEIPVINLYQPFRQAFQTRRPPTGFNNSILGEGHLNSHGHQLVTKEIVRFLEETKLVFDKQND